MSLEQTIPHIHNGSESQQDESNTPNSPDNEDDDKRDSLSEKKTGRRKINIEFIEDKSRRHITFSKRKAGIMKKAYELSTLTGTQVLLLVASETGHVYTFATPKLQPLITKAEGKNLIQACLNAQEPTAPAPVHTPRLTQGGYSDPNLLYPAGDSRENQIEAVYDEEKKDGKGYPMGLEVSAYQNSGPPYASPNLVTPMYSMPSMAPSSRNYLPSQYPPPPSASHTQYPASSQGSQGQYSPHPGNQYSNYGMPPVLPPGLPPAPWNMKPPSLLNSPPAHNQQLQKQEHQPEHST